MPGRAYEALFELASDQYGYLSQDQAVKAGFRRGVLVDMQRRGRVTRVAQGLYRFNAFPHDQLDLYMEATLWPLGARGVLSHETALDLYEISDVNPRLVHLTLPLKHRISREVPKLYQLHFESLESLEVSCREGLPITTVERTLRDCHRAHSRRDLLAQALQRARARGMLSAATVEALVADGLPEPAERPIH
jgi:predicted transcriptional regulator of viral defense system